MGTALRLRAELWCKALVMTGVVGSGALFLAMEGAVLWYRVIDPGLLRAAFFSGIDAPLTIVSAIAVFVLARPVLTRGGALWHAALFAAIGVTLFFAEEQFLWVGEGIADYYGIYGRFGCGWDELDCSPTYWFRNDTLPLFIFGPSLLGVAGHWVVRRPREKSS
jgi:hypothetical protein